MDLRPIKPFQKQTYNRTVTHLMQSWQWGEFRQSLGTPLLRYGLFEDDSLKTAFQLTLHRVPFLDSYIGYLPKGPKPDKALAQALREIGQVHRCLFIKVEPNILAQDTSYIKDPAFQPSAKPYFTKYNFVLNLTLPETKLMENLHPKTRYNIRLAQKKGVRVEERTDDQAFEAYLKLYFDTTKRQGYLGHNPDYHRKAWKTLKQSGMARLLLGFWDHIPLSAWMLVNFKDTLYYPYGGSSVEHKEVMANNLVAWEAIRLGKKLNLKQLDMWGALGPDADSSDPWFGFHRFKQGYSGELVEYVGTFDVVFNPTLYRLLTVVDQSAKFKARLLKLARR